MVSFHKILLSSMALASPITAQITPDQLVTNIKTLTQKSQSLLAPAQNISIANLSLPAVGEGSLPAIINGFLDIVSTATTAIAQLSGMPPVLPGEESDDIFDAFREFVRVHQELLNIMLGKSGLFNAVPVIGAPVAAVLRQIENVVDTIAAGLINAVESRASDLQAQAQALRGTLDEAIKVFSGLSAPLAKRSMRFARREVAPVA
ncbi:hypothetical protein T440DRAFT_548076 [Plenodomus tracheiphilus IPT5]|uniref:UVI-1 protein n=1 Tax=Plenodomus tracheiphilus IPT5 TaxID=1408161 RepID=A0A6A7ANM8_9PLEO|nr:hypothetical protein T440DRAFT_548076 [Plenodomus tracheiphilus IPT5]